MRSMMKFSKPALSPQRLIELMGQRGLPLAASGDLEVARHALRRIGYFRLSGFMIPFVHAAGALRHQFKAGATISHIVDLHDFDAGLRTLCMEALGHIEVAIRVSTCDHLARTHGPHWPLSSKPFKPGQHAPNLKALADSVHFDLDRQQPRGKSNDRPTFLERYYAKYTHPSTRMPPGWMVAECSTFRTWAFLFDALMASEQKQISDAWRFPSGKRIDHAILGSWLHSLSILRNRCAHHSRIIHKAFPFPPSAPKDPSVASLMTGSRTDLRTLIVVMVLLIRSIDAASTWPRKLFKFFEGHVTRVDINAAVGFRAQGLADWRSDPLWSV